MHQPSVSNGRGDREVPREEMEDEITPIPDNTSSPGSEHGHSRSARSWESGSEYSQSSMRALQPSALRDMRADVMVNWLHSKQEERLWSTGAIGEGVVLKITKGHYVCCPAELRNDSTSLFNNISGLGVRVCPILEPRCDLSC
jgi:hypothetical protein